MICLYYMIFYVLFSISEVTGHIMVNPNQTAQLVCTVDANPIKEDTIKWVREGYDMTGRVKTMLDGNTLYLTIVNATEADAGEFECVVNNGIGGGDVKNTSFLVVKRELMMLCDTGKIELKIISELLFTLDAPKIDQSPAIAKSASDKGEVATLNCKATGAPDIMFMWSRLGTVIQHGVTKLGDEGPAEEGEDVPEDAKYTISSSMLDRYVYHAMPY